VLFSSTDGRQKVRNLRRDPRVSLSVFDLANPYTWVEIRGTAEVLPDEAKRLTYELSHKYLGTDPPAEKEGGRGARDHPRGTAQARGILGLSDSGSAVTASPHALPGVAGPAQLRVRAPGGAARMKGAGTRGAFRAAPAVRHGGTP
jgi:hypothetical protein